MGDIKVPSILTRTNIDLGDTGALNVSRVLNGVKFTIVEKGRDRASVTLDLDRARWIIGVLCRLTGVTEIRKSAPKEG